MTRTALLMLRRPENGSSELIVTLFPGFNSAEKQIYAVDSKHLNSNTSKACHGEQRNAHGIEQ
jgi:hypothetical protein